MNKVMSRISRGILITLQGPNGVGKTTERERLVNDLSSRGFSVISLKYPIYTLASGKKISMLLRETEGYVRTYEKLPTPLEEQALFAENRREFQPQLERYLIEGNIVVCEDYIGTGIAWGMARNVSQSELERINEDLLSPDLSILMLGDSFPERLEKKHRNENDPELLIRAREIHEKIAGDYNWKIVERDSSLPLETLEQEEYSKQAVHLQVMLVLEKTFSNMFDFQFQVNGEKEFVDTSRFQVSEVSS